MSIPQIGDRIRITSLIDDPCPLEIGAEGIVKDLKPTMVHGEIQIVVSWNISRSLCLLSPTDDDRFEILPKRGAENGK